MEREMLADHMDRTAGELRLQLAQITAASQMLEGHAVDQKGKAYLAMVNQSVCRMLRVVGRLELAYRLTDDNEIRLSPQPIEFGSWTRGLGERIQGVLAGLGVALTYSGPEYLVGGADQGLLEQLVLELVANGAREGKQVTLNVAGDEEKLRISISDNGDGVSGEKLSRLLSQDCDEEGCGMAIAQQITELHGGALMADSGVGRGLTMTAIIPLRKIPAGHRLESAWVPWDAGGFDQALVAFSHLLPADAFLPEYLG